MNTKVKLKKDNNTDWTNTKNESFPLSTASHSFHQDWNIIEGEKVVSYRIIDCPQCHNSQKVKNKIILDNSDAGLANFRCPWCNSSFVLDVNLLHSPYHIERADL